MNITLKQSFKLLKQEFYVKIAIPHIILEETKHQSNDRYSRNTGYKRHGVHSPQYSPPCLLMSIL